MERSQEHGEADQGVGVDEEARALCRAEQSRRESESESTPEPEPEPEPEPDAEQPDVMAVSVSLSKPQPRENGSVARSSAPVGVFAKLSKEQLIEYTKKQKKEIKKLKGEISQFHDERSAQIESNEIASNNNASFDLFWELLDRRPQWQQRLAKVSVSSLLGHAPTLQRAARATLHSAFYQWSAQTSRSYRSHIRGALQESKMTNAHLEQRVVKLKGLLAKVHHSNQKNVQDTQSARQGHRVAAEELRERVQEQQSQTQLLQQQLRYMSFESAFQTDMETAIEKASQQLTSHQQTAVGAHHVDNAHLAEKVVELEGHLQALRMEMDEKSEVINSLRKQLVSSQHDKAIADRELQLQRRRAADIRAENVLLQQCTREQDLVQRELELEVRALVAGGADMTARVDAAANEKAAQAVKELQESLHNAGEAVQREKQRADVAENKIERLGRDLATTRMKTSDLVKVRAENDRLSLLLRELKRSSMDLNIQQVVTKTTSTPEKIEMRGETDYISMERRVLGYLLHPFDDVKMAQLFEDSVDQTNRIVTSIDQLKRFHSSNVCMTTPFGNGNCSSKSVIAKAWMAELCKDFSSSLGLNCVERCLQDIEPTDSVREIIADVIVHESDVQINIGNMNHDTYTGDESLLARYAACSVRLKELERDALNISFASMRNHLTKVDGEGTQCILTDLPSPREVEVFNWNASSITLLAGREINLPVPFPHGQKVGKRCRYFLKWQIRGSQLDSLQLELHPLGNDSVIPTLVLDSAHTLAARFDGDDRRSSSNDEGTFVLHGVTALQGGRDQMLRISNIASWVTASISYTIKLCTTIVADFKVCEGVEERKLVKGSTVSPASALSSFSVHHECIRGKVIEGLHLWSTLQSQLEEWRTLSASFEILCRSRFDELTLQFCDDARTRRAFVEELSHQYSSFQGNVELVEKHFTDDAMFHVRGQAPLSAQLDIPHHQCSKDDKHNGGDKSEIHGHLPCHSVDANFNLRTVFCAAELKIRPAQDFRCPLRTPLRKDVEEGYYLISWDFELLDESKPSLTRSGTVPSLDIGFCVLAKELDGSLPQLKPYRRINNCDREGMTGSLRYRVSDDRTRHSKLIDGPFHSEICAPFQEIVVLFDNSYSWVTPKLLRYEVSVEFVLEKLLLELQEDPLPGVNSSTSVDVVHGKSDEHAHTSERALDFNLPADEVGHNQNGTNINSILVTDRDRIITVRSGVDVVVDQSQTQHRLEQAAIAMDEAAHRVLVTAVEVRQFCSDVFMMNGSAKSNDEFY